MDFRAEDRAREKRREHVRQQQIGHSLQLITGRRMSGDVNPERAQLLHQPPDLGAAGTDFVGDLGAADHDGGVVHQQTHNPSQSQIRLLRRGFCDADAAARETSSWDPGLWLLS